MKLKGLVFETVTLKSFADNIMPNCSAIGCSNSSGFKHLASFPRDPVRRKLWVSKVRRKGWEPTDNSRLCEVHFKENQFEINRVDGRKKLKRNAVPTVFDYQGDKLLKLSTYRKRKSTVRRERTVPSSSNASSKICNRDQQRPFMLSTDTDDHLPGRKLNSNEVDKNVESFLPSKIKGNFNVSYSSIESLKMQPKLLKATGALKQTTVLLLQDDFSENHNEDQHSTSACAPLADIDYHLSQIQSNSNEVDKNMDSLVLRKLESSLKCQLENMQNDANQTNLIRYLGSMSSSSIKSIKIQLKLLKATGALKQIAVPLLRDGFLKIHDEDQHSTSLCVPFANIDPHLSEIQSNSNEVDKNVESVGSSELNDLDSKLENVLNNMKNKGNLIRNLENMSTNSIELTKMQIKLLKEAGASLLYD